MKLSIRLPFAAIFVAIGLGGAALSVPAQAQEAQNAPRPLFGKARDEAEKSKPEELPALPGSDGAVLANDLDILGVNIFGLLTDIDGGFGDYMWQGSALRVIAPAVRGLDGPGISSSRQDLFARLLESRAYDPAGEAGAGPFLTLRARKLFDAGFIREAEMLLDQETGKTSDLSTERLRAEIALLSQRSRQACAIAAKTRRRADSSWWARLRTFCYIVAEDYPSARLNAELLADQGVADPLFQTLLTNRIDNAGLPIEGFEITDSIHFAMIVEGDGTVTHGFPRALLNTRSVPLRAAAFSMAGLLGRGLEDQLQVEIPLAEEGVMRGNLIPTRLSVLYGAVNISADEVRSLVEAEAPSTPSPRRAASLYQAISLNEDPVEQARLLGVAWTDAKRFQREALFRAIYRDQIRLLEPDSVLDVHAMDLAEASLVAGAWDRAGQWLALAKFALSRQGIGAGPQHDRIADLSIVLQILAPESSANHLRGMRRFDPIDHLTKNMGTERAQRTLLEVRLYEALGNRLEPDALRLISGYPVPPQGKMPARGVLSGLDAAARAGRKGEAVLFALTALGDSNSAQIPVIVTAKCVEALTLVNFSEEAKTLALESLLAL